MLQGPRRQKARGYTAAHSESREALSAPHQAPVGCISWLCVPLGALQKTHTVFRVKFGPSTYIVILSCQMGVSPNQLLPTSRARLRLSPLVIKLTLHSISLTFRPLKVRQTEAEVLTSNPCVRRMKRMKRNLFITCNHCCFTALLVIILCIFMLCYMVLLILSYASTYFSPVQCYKYTVGQTVSMPHMLVNQFPCYTWFSKNNIVCSS